MASARVAPLVLVLFTPALAHAFDELPTRPAPEPPKPPVLTRAPELKRFVEAQYPAEALAAGLTGEVGMTVDIARDGTVQAVEVTQAAGHGFDEAAAAAARQFEFTPAELDGAPAAVRIAYTYHFVLEPLPPPRAPAQPPASMRGRILQRGTRDPVAGASVRCVDRDEEAVTDAKGRFELHPPPGDCEAVVVAPGYQRFARHETIVSGEPLDRVYFLMPTSRGHFQTKVRGERDRREATRRSLTREQLESVPGSFGDPIRVVHDLPGVARMPYSGGQLAIRGASPADSGAYMDGVQIPILFHFLNGPSVVNAEFLDRLDFLPGGFGPRYGRAVGGIVEADTRRGGADAVHGSFKLDLIDSAGFLEAPATDRLTVAVAARRSYIDALLPSFTPSSSTGTISVLPRYWDYQGRADYGRAGDASQFTVMAFGSDDRLSVATRGGQQDRSVKLGMHTGFHRLRLGWTVRAGAVTNTFAPYLGRDTRGYGTDAPTDGLGLQGATWAAGLRDEVTWELDGEDRAHFGTDFALASSRFAGMLPALADYRVFPGAAGGPLEYLTRRNTILDFGFYNQWELRAARRLTLLPGLRVDEYWLAGRSRGALDPRVAARYQLTRTTVLKGGLGHYSRAPDADQLDPQWGNPTLRLPKAIQSSLGFEQQLVGPLSLDVTGFFNWHYDRVVASARVVATADGALRPEYYGNDGFGRAYGVEVLLRHEMTPRFFGWLAYTLSRSEARQDGVDATGYQLTSLDETHILTAVAQYRLGGGWSLGARFQLTSGRPTTPVVGSSYDADADRYVPALGSRLSDRNPPFQQLDLRVDREWIFERWRLGAYLEVQNVYWAKNVEAVQWDYRFQQKTEIPGMPILPTLGLKGSF